MSTTTLNRSVALLTLRLLLGLIFVLQGYGKVFGWGVEPLYQSDTFLGTYESLLPNWLIYFTAYYTSYVELIGGALLLVGWQRDWVLYALASVLVIVTFGHGLAQPIWNVADVGWRAVLLLTLLLLPVHWDRFSLDGWLNQRAPEAQQ